MDESVLLDYSAICVGGLGFITLHTLLVLQASHREVGLRVNLMAYIAVVGQKPHICRKSAFRKEESNAFPTGFIGPEVMKLTQHIH